MVDQDFGRQAAEQAAARARDAAREAARAAREATRDARRWGRTHGGLWGGQDPRVQMTSRAIGGLVVLTLGVLFTLDSLNVLDAGDYIRYWPLALVAIGVKQIVGARTPARVVAGVIWIVIGGTMVSDNLRLLRVAWPLFLVFVGGYIAWRAISTRSVVEATADAGAAPSDAVGSTVSVIGVLSGFDRKVRSQQFQGGEVTAFMGGGKLDLRDAAPAGGRAVIDVFAVMGGFEILVPETWAVVIEAVPFLGGVEDKTRPPKPPIDGAAPTLIVRGFVMMGGVEIKN